MKLNKSVAVVTGGGGHIGRQIVARLAEQAATVIVCDIDLQAAQIVADEATKLGGNGVAIAVDVKDSRQVEKVITDVVDRFGKIDILVTAAGGSARSKSNMFIHQTDDVIHDVIGINLFGTMYFVRAVARQMVKQRQGKIICISSVVGVNGLKGHVEYSASKGAVNAMVKSLAMELGEYGITVNCVSPGIVLRPEETRSVTHTNWLRGVGKAEHIANLVNFLACEQDLFITGQNYIVDGGRSIGLKGSD